MKHRLHKLFAALLAVMLLVSCLSLTAFADDQVGSGDEAEETVKHTYVLYQIFTGTANTENGVTTLSDLKWGKNGTGTEKNAVDSTVRKDLEKVSSDSSYSDSEQLAVIKQYANLVEEDAYSTTQPTKSGTTYVYNDLPAGYYLIADKAGSLAGKNATYTLYVAKVTSGKLVFEPKGSTPTVDKVIVDDGDKTANEAAIGETITYKLTGRISSEVANYNTYYYEFNDTLSKGLTYSGKDKVKVMLYFSAEDTTGKDVTKYFYISNGTSNSDGSTSIKIAMGDLKQLENLKDTEGNQLITLGETVRVVVTYEATLNQNAVINGANTNKVKLVFSNDPNNSGTGKNKDTPSETPEEPTKPDVVGETPEKEVSTYTTGLYITKTNSEGDRLSGAEFTLTGANIIKVKVATSTKFVEITDDNPAQEGEAIYYELISGAYTKADPNAEGADKKAYQAADDGTYKQYRMVTSTDLVEAKEDDKGNINVVGTVDKDSGVIYFVGLGAGTYTLAETTTPAGYNTMDPVTFTISFKDGVFSSTHDSIKFDSNDGLFHEVAINYPGSSLPHTGGIGTTIFYVAGTAMILCAGILLISKKRMKREGE
jgi:fimbrial isopeptide formation D2 family protein/LPXTG-motif cell wall-anchored protein